MTKREKMLWDRERKENEFALARIAILERKKDNTPLSHRSVSYSQQDKGFAGQQIGFFI